MRSLRDHPQGGRGAHDGPQIARARDGFREEERARKLLCTGLSRARVLVVVVGPLGEITRLGGEGVRRRLHDAVAWSPGR